jgi:flagellar biosynthesis chaperone FliJ
MPGPMLRRLLLLRQEERETEKKKLCSANQRIQNYEDLLRDLLLYYRYPRGYPLHVGFGRARRTPQNPES